VSRHLVGEKGCTTVSGVKTQAQRGEADAKETQVKLIEAAETLRPVPCWDCINPEKKTQKKKRGETGDRSGWKLGRGGDCLTDPRK